MRLSTKSRYAINAMLDLAINGGERPVTLSEISASQGISLSYLEQLFSAMRAKGLVRGVRGPGGGYYLERAPDRVSIADIICAVDEWVDFTRNGDQQARDDSNQLCARSLWDDLSQQIFDFVGGITLQGLIDRHVTRIAAESIDERRAA